MFKMAHRTLGNHLDLISSGEETIEDLRTLRFKNLREKGWYYIKEINNGVINVIQYRRRFRVFPRRILPEKYACGLNTNMHLNDPECLF